MSTGASRLDATKKDTTRNGGLWPLYRALAGLGALCAALVATGWQLSSPIIDQKRLEALEAAVQRVVPGAVTTRPFAWTGEHFEPATRPADAAVWAAFRDDGTLAGVAVTGAAMGYQDTVRILWGYDPARHAVVGLQVLESRETPGLGDRVGFDPGFLAGFTDLAVPLDRTDATAVAHPLTLSDGKAPAEPWEIDGLSGATISSRAVVAALGEATAVWVPRIEAHVTDFVADIVDREGAS